MATFAFSESKQFVGTELVGLYASVGWSVYASDPDSLVRAVEQSSYVVSARDSSGALVGLARAISDDVSICYLQDTLVSSDDQRSGIGKALVERVLERYVHVRQKVLLTDDEPGQRLFYESMGFIEGHDFGPTPLRAFVQIGSE
ncbi:GNAT family N-acetyltransferase [Cryobacterium cryoconiti]|uniref:N-acetyltransferase n=1 Tax=Cryobacterium cryoconiti TaxID=1259239 RepID=A0A4Y8JR52_9MICO|nr:GNAT family N-acetyltransferase [Cryobacterium cryoconiti]TFD27037.1 N-acetyltransferase [Cryobacterium cryoconiti]